MKYEENHTEYKSDEHLYHSETHTLSGKLAFIAVMSSSIGGIFFFPYLSRILAYTISTFLLWTIRRCPLSRAFFILKPSSSLTFPYQITIKWYQKTVKRFVFIFLATILPTKPQQTEGESRGRTWKILLILKEKIDDWILVCISATDKARSMIRQYNDRNWRRGNKTKCTDCPWVSHPFP